MFSTQYFRVAILAASFLVFFGCKEEGPKVLTGTITFTKGTVLINDLRARIGEAVRAQDVINVKKASGAIIQFSTGALITLKSKTKLEVSRLFYGEGGTPVVDLNQKKGSTFSKIVPNKAKYSLSTPTAVAGVRGTAFAVTVTKDKKSEIHLLRGKVAVNSKKKGKVSKKTKMIKTGQKVEISKKGVEKPKKLAKEEKAGLKELDKVTFVSQATLNLDTKKREAELTREVKTTVPDKIVKAVINEKIVIEKEPVVAATTGGTTAVAKPKPKPLTLADLKKKYGKLTKIITHSGKSYVGGDWKQVGDYHYIQTVKGKQKVATSKVFKVLPFD